MYFIFDGMLLSKDLIAWQISMISSFVSLLVALLTMSKFRSIFSTNSNSLISANACNDLNEDIEKLMMKIREEKTRTNDTRMLDYYLAQLHQNSQVSAKGFFIVDRLHVGLGKSKTINIFQKSSDWNNINNSDLSACSHAV